MTLVNSFFLFSGKRKTLPKDFCLLFFLPFEKRKAVFLSLPFFPKLPPPPVPLLSARQSPPPLKQDCLPAAVSAVQQFFFKFLHCWLQTANLTLPYFLPSKLKDTSYRLERLSKKRAFFREKMQKKIELQAKDQCCPVVRKGSHCNFKNLNQKYCQNWQ